MRNNSSSKMANSSLNLFYSILLSTLIISTAIDTIEPTQPIRDGQTIVSAGGKYQLGFFSPNNSENRFVAIWFNQIPVHTTVWIANRNAPLTDSSGNFTVTNQGLAVVNGTGNTVWSSNGTARNPIAQLLDSGNLVFRERNDTNPENYIWQSFDYPTDTLLAGMKLGTNNVTNVNRYLSSWKSDIDPSIGNFTFQLDPRGYPQLVMMQGSSVHYSSGPWNGLRFSGSPNLRPNPYYRFYFVYDQQEIYYAYELLNSDVTTRLGINPSGYVTRFVWNNQTLLWDILPSIVIDVCDNYDFCGEYTSCNIDNTPQCGCLKGFEPKREWAAQDWTHGCVRKTDLDPDCGKGVGFFRYSGIKLPDTRNSWFDRSMSLEDCRVACLNNCTCTAYTSLNISDGGSGCLVWFGELVNIREYPENGQVIYLRVASSDLATNNKKLIIYIVSATSVAGTVLLGLSLIMYIRRKKKLRKRVLKKKEMSEEGSETSESHKENLELPLFDYATIANATNNFSDDNKLGEGGFGPVYKGILEDGQEIAVKKLSRSSRQGIDEFKNEVLCIAKLQHRNLVKLLGCCIHVEKILVYEYMPNKSLDYFIFDERQSKLLDWNKHFKIINGISRGLLYLHQDSRLRIIHRDLKASNILLDYEMNPKISDFGMARSFRDHETEANTNRVVGTYGYMSPEYAIDGLFSTKSDVFSFGVLVLEIVSGKKNRGFIHQEHSLNLLGHAWNLHKEGRGIEVVNECFRDSCNQFEALRSIHVGLLCVQQSPEDRPSMSTVVLMLSSNTELPQPKLPGFYGERVLLFEGNSSQYDSVSANEMTDTIIDPR